MRKHRGLMFVLMAFIAIIGSVIWGMSAKMPECERPPDLF